MNLKKKIIYNRIILKISGDFLQKDNYLDVNNDLINNFITVIKNIIPLGVQIGIVIGGGSIFKGKKLAQNNNIKTVLGDHIGILSTIINGLLLCSQMNLHNINTVIMSAVAIKNICDEYNIIKALNLIKNNHIIIFVGGLGCPAFTTDTAACLRGIELEADAIFKITKVNGVFAQDPIKFPHAKFYKKIDYNFILYRQLNIMDHTSIILSRDANIPIHILNINKIGFLQQIITGCSIKGEVIGTLITNI
ncbi:UMP kinase [Enterobacteriaceae endosymbiont of Macroplea appendiculata]|uniref:UMP kinase n=1 Tax=Enterobacteriaceae endosymbiont of Macroplea appendiculata TaxID=2675790 RepID=UPI001448FAC6|nr:UMP kinase [Enterobacteriaceae endosymbiont of Macroplea appendiculata]QJC30843.1 UMP kinase [Enterobacteriaceae endosymbiont of Macroplea appendiculata]